MGPVEIVNAGWLRRIIAMAFGRLDHVIIGYNYYFGAWMGDTFYCFYTTRIEDAD